MDEYDDFDINPDDDPEESRPIGMMVAVALVVIALVGIGMYWFMGSEEEQPVAPVPERQTRAETPPPRTLTPPEPVEPAPVDLPPLDESDGIVREFVAAISSHPDLAEWLVTDGLIRRFVVAVDNIADGRNPAQHVPFMRPAERFAVAGEEPSMRVDPRSYRRYDGLAQIFNSLDTAGSVELYLRLETMMDEAYRDLGYPDEKFRSTVARAIDHLLEVPITDGPPEVVRGAAYYEYPDERLDSLSPVQKQLLGMGPDNVRAVQAKLRALASAMSLNVG